MSTHFNLNQEPPCHGFDLNLEPPCDALDLNLKPPNDGAHPAATGECF
jgi:hypothetical protein